MTFRASISSPAGSSDSLRIFTPYTMKRLATRLTDTPGWAQRPEMPEDGFYREFEAISPALSARLADAFATNNVWRFDAVREAWPDLRQRALEEGSAAPVLDLVYQVEAQGNPIAGGQKIGRKPKPVLSP